MLEDALYYPTETDDWTTTVLVGSGLLLVPQLVLVVFLIVAFFTFGIGFVLFPLVLPFFLTGLFVLGFYVRILRRTVAGDDRYPRFSDWGELFVDGVVAVAIGFVYGLVPMVAIGVTSLVGVGAGSLGGVSTAGDVFALLSVGIILVGMAVTVLLALVVFYVYPASLTNYAARDSIGAAFAVGDLRRLLFAKEYALAWLLAVGVTVAVSVISSFLGWLPLVGAILTAPVGFVGGSVSHRLYGVGYRRAME